jgi:phage terminase large subunit-like protein
MKLKECKKFYFDEKSADRAQYFIENHIHHIKGSKGGEKFLLEPFQEKIVRDLFGWKYRDSGLRRFRTAYICLPRKNGKSTLISAIALYCTIALGEPSAESYVAAGSRQQAGIIFDVASSMVKADKQLSKHLKVFKNSIVHEKSNSAFKALSSEASTKLGYNCSFLAMDEFAFQKDASLYDALSTSMGARTEPLTICITTAGFNRESIAYKTEQYGLKVSEGIIDDSSFYFVKYSCPLDVDWTSEEALRIANPGLESGIVKMDYLKREQEKAIKMPSFENAMRMYYLNQWMSSSSKWLSDQQWMGCDFGPINLQDYKGRTAYCGLDLATVRDVSAFIILIPEDDKFIVVPYFFVPKDNAFIRSRRDQVDYVGWAKEYEQTGMILTEGDVTDYTYIEKKIKEVAEILNIKEIAYDRWNSSMLVTSLVSEGLPMIPFGQGFASMSTPTKELEKLILGKQINHQGNKVLRWMASNVALKIDPAQNCKVDKSKSTERVDGIVALVMALGAFMNDDSDDSAYDDRGILWL